MDVFIAHASEDKEAVARPLADELRRRGFGVWYDEYSLRVGDSLNEKINHGLALARFGVVIISPNFIEKEWPQRELSGLLAVDEGERRGHILPIWHNVTAAQVKVWNPIIAERVATSTSKGLPAVVDDIAAVLQGRAAPRLPAAVLPTGEARQMTMNADDSRDLLERAQAAIPRQTGMGIGTGTVVLAVSGGPSAVLLRPSETRDATLGQRLLEQAVMGGAAVLKKLAPSSDMIVAHHRDRPQ
jgi:TIR domain